MSLMMFNFNTPPDLPPQLQWKYAHEPELLKWTIQARNYNTFVANCMFGFMAILTLGWSLVMYSVYDDMGQPWRIFWCIVFFTFALSTISFMTHQRMNFAYRFTQTGVEYCKWKDFPKWALPFLKWFSIITAILFIFLATIDPVFLIGALIGPGGMGLMYLSMAYSKSYREMHTQYHHHEFEWKDFTQLAIATNREVVDLKYSLVIDGNDYVTHWNLNLFCKKNEKHSVASFIKPYLTPGTPCITAKVNVPMSTD